MDFVSRLSEDEKAYTALPPLSYRGELRPDLVQKKLRIREIRNLLQKMEGGIPLSPEALRDLLKQDRELDLEISDGEMEEFWQGLFATDLKTAKTGGSPLKQPKRGQTPEGLKSELKSLISEIGEDTGEDAYFYDEWDYLIQMDRPAWCTLLEKPAPLGDPRELDEILCRNGETVHRLTRLIRTVEVFAVLQTETCCSAG